MYRRAYSDSMATSMAGPLRSHFSFDPRVSSIVRTKVPHDNKMTRKENRTRNGKLSQCSVAVYGSLFARLNRTYAQRIRRECNGKTNGHSCRLSATANVNNDDENDRILLQWVLARWLKCCQRRPLSSFTSSVPTLIGERVGSCVRASVSASCLLHTFGWVLAHDTNWASR